MASATNVDRHKREVEDSVTCRICLEIYEDPRNLSCTHTFCLQCLMDLQKGMTPRKCPVCSQLAVPPKNELTGLTKNEFARQLVTLLKTQAQENTATQKRTSTIAYKNNSTQDYADDPSESRASVQKMVNMFNKQPPPMAVPAHPKRPVIPKKVAAPVPPKPVPPKPAPRQTPPKPAVQHNPQIPVQKNQPRDGANQTPLVQRNQPRQAQPQPAAAAKPPMDNDEEDPDFLRALRLSKEEHEKKVQEQQRPKSSSSSSSSDDDGLLINLIAGGLAQAIEEARKEAQRERAVRELRNQLVGAALGEMLSRAVQAIHNDIVCDHCGEENIAGNRYKCGLCADYDLCTDCFRRSPQFHDRTHLFVKLKKKQTRLVGQGPVLDVAKGLLLGMTMSRSNIHSHVRCDKCNECPIRGVRYKCGICDDYDLCSSCEDDCEEFHPSSHTFVVIPFDVMLAGVGRIQTKSFY